MKKKLFFFLAGIIFSSFAMAQQNGNPKQTTGTKPVNNNQVKKNTGGSNTKQGPQVQSMPPKNYDPYTNTTVDLSSDQVPHSNAQQKKPVVVTGHKN